MEKPSYRILAFMKNNLDPQSPVLSPIVNKEAMVQIVDSLAGSHNITKIEILKLEEEE